MNELEKIKIGEIFKIENQFIYIKSTKITSNKKNIILFDNEILTPPKIGSFVKVENIYSDSGILKIIGKRNIMTPNGEFKIWKCKFCGSFNKVSGFQNSNSDLINIYDSVHLFTNKEISLLNKFQPQDGVFINEIGFIKNSDAQFYLNTNFFTSDILFIGDQHSGKTHAVSNIYKSLFDKFISTFSKNQKFIFFDYKDEYSKLFSSAIFKNNLDKIKKYNFKSRPQNINLITLKKFLNVFKIEYDELILLSQSENEIQKKFIVDFYDELHFKRKINYLEDLFVNSTMNSKTLTQVKKIWTYINNIYQNELVNEENTLSKILEVYNNLFFENGLYISKIFLKENRNRFKDFFDFNEFKKTNDDLLIEISQEKFLVVLNSFIKTKRKNSLSEFKEKLTNIIENNVELLIQSKFVSWLSLNEQDFFVINEIIENFSSNWNYMTDLFGSLNEMNQNENVIILNFSNLSKDQQEIITLLFLKLVLKNNRFFAEMTSYINLIIDDLNNIFWKNNLNGHLLKYKKETIELLLKRKSESLVFLNYIVNSIDETNIELLNMFDNIGIFSTKNENLKNFLFNNFKYKFIEEFEMSNLLIGEVILIGKNINLPIIVKLNKQVNTKKEIGYNVFLK